MKIGNREFAVGEHTYVMGILNITPDSFSDGGLYLEKDKALYRVEKMIEEGMDILDIGGESTRPGHEQITAGAEVERVIPLLEQIKSRFDIPISLDTYKARVAEAGILAGADLINDIWGLRRDPDMAGVISRSKLPCCLMHNRQENEYSSFLEDVASDLSQSVYLAEQAGIADDRIILDPGIGFGKNYEQNLCLIHNLEKLHAFGYPLLLAASRKSVIGTALDLPVDERLEGTLALSVLAVVKKCSFVRVHDIRENVRAIRMAEAVLQEG